MSPEIAHLFGHHKPRTPEQASQIEAARSRYAEFATWLEAALPAGREKAMAKTKLEELSFWGNAVLARAWGPAEPIKEPSQ